MCYIDAESVIKKLNIRLNSLNKALKVLSDEGILEYDILTEQPVARLSEARSVRYPFSKKQLEAHRNALLSKLDFIKGYTETESCRSRYLRVYFGEMKVPAECGFCDVCIGKTQKKADIFTTANIKEVHEILDKGPAGFNDIRRTLKMSPSHLKNLLTLMTREDMIQARVSEKGMHYIIKGKS